MVVPRSLFQLLVEALQDSRPGMAPDDPAEITRRYPQNGVSNSRNAEAQTRFRPPVDAPPRDPNFRQLSRAPFVAQVQTPVRSNVQPNLPDYLWNAPLQHAGSVGAYGDGPTLPRWSPPPPPMLPVPGGRLAIPRTSGLGGPMPPPSTTSPPNIPMPPMPEAWRIFGPILMLNPELLRERLFGERGESKNADAAADPIHELEQRRPGKAGSKAGNRPATILNAPGIVPDAPGEAPDTDDDGNKFCHDRWEREMDRCKKRFPGVRACEQMASNRRNLCVGNNGRPRLDEPEQWGNY